MEVRQIDEGLWRWTAPHPAWTPERGGKGGWERMVGSVYYESSEAIVLIDPLAPPAGSADAEKFWTALDRDVERCGLPVAVLLGNAYHGRSAREMYQRFAGRVGAEIHLPETAVGRVTWQPTHTFGRGGTLPGGLIPRFLPGLFEHEVAFFLPQHRALVVADALIGAGGGALRVAPADWGEEGVERYRTTFLDSLRGLLELDVERVLPSHGEPVLENGRAALAAALAAPVWGED